MPGPMPPPPPPPPFQVVWSRMSWSFKGFIATFSCLFGIYTYLTFIHGVLGIRIPGHTLIVSFGPYLLYLAMVGLGGYEYWRLRNRSPILSHPTLKMAIGIYIVICLLMALQAPINLSKSKSIYGFLDASLSWFLPVVLVFGLQREQWLIIRKMVCWQSAIGCVALLFAKSRISSEIAMSDQLTSRVDLVEAGGGILFYGMQLIYAGHFLLLSFRFLPFIWRFVAIATIGLTLWVALVGQFRSGVATIAMAVFIGLIFIPMRVKTNDSSGGMKWMVSMLALAFVGFGAYALISSRGPLASSESVLSRSMEGMIRRNTSSSSGWIPYGVEDRVQESTEALRESNIVQLVVGKGLGATWSGGTIFSEQRNMLHVSIGHFILHGGIILLLFAILGPLRWSIRVFRRSRSEIALVSAGLLLLHMAGSLIANIFLPSLGYILFLLCLGGSLSDVGRRPQWVGRPRP